MQHQVYINAQTQTASTDPIAGFTNEELQLISAVLYSTRLGNGISPYRDAAFSAMQKLETQFGVTFCADAFDAVAPMIGIDVANQTVELSEFEILV